MKGLELQISSRISLGADSLSQLGRLAKPLGTRALLVADSILTTGPLPKQIAAILEENRVDLITHRGVPPDAFHDCIGGIASLVKASQAQIVLGLGGIRALATAKAVAALAMEDCRPDEFLDGAFLPKNQLNYIEIPTTCRNPFMLRDEVLLLDSRNRHSHIISIPGFLPKAVVLCPNTAASLPPKYSFATLMDTFLFALEGFISDQSSFLSDCLFLKAIEQIIHAVNLSENPENQEAFREYAFQGGFTAALGLSLISPGIGSSLAFALAGRLRVPKSLLGAMFLPEVLERGVLSAPDKLARLAPILSEDIQGMTPPEAARKTAEGICGRLEKILGDLRLTDIDLSQDVAADAAEQVYALPNRANGPGALSTEALLGMIQKSL